MNKLAEKNSLPNGVPESEKKIMEDKLAVINKANECSVLMTLLCQKLGLEPTKTTHQEFVQRFSELQTKSLDYQKELQELYISTTKVKPKQKRTRAVVLNEEGESPFETTDKYVNGDYK